MGTQFYNLDLGLFIGAVSYTVLYLTSSYWLFTDSLEIQTHSSTSIVGLTTTNRSSQSMRQHLWVPIKMPLHSIGCESSLMSKLYDQWAYWVVIMGMMGEWVGGWILTYKILMKKREKKGLGDSLLNYLVLILPLWAETESRQSIFTFKSETRPRKQKMVLGLRLDLSSTTLLH